MRILYVQQHFATDQGAAGLRGFNLVRTMADRGHDVTVIAGENWRDPSLRVPRGRLRAVRDLNGVRLVVLGVPYSNRFGFASRVASFLAFAVLASWECVRRPADVVYASSTPLTVAVPALAARVVRRRPYVLEVRDLWPDLAVAMGVLTNRPAIAALEWFERLAYRHASLGVGLAPGVVEAMVSRGRLDPADVVMVPNAADTRGTTPRPGRPRRLLRVADAVVTFGYTGTFGPANAVAAVLDVAAELRRRGEGGVAFALVGAGKERDALAARIAAEGLDRVVMLDLADKSTYADLLGELDVGLQILAPVPAFAYGTSPQKFFEYLAAGRPVIVNYRGWMADIVAGADCGIGLDPGDVSAFADAVIALRDDPERRAAMGDRARRLAVDEFDQWTLLPNLVAELERRVEGAPGRSR